MYREPSHQRADGCVAQNASKRQRKLWEAYDRDLAERENMEQQNAYFQGVRFGAKLMMDVFLELPDAYEERR